MEDLQHDIHSTMRVASLAIRPTYKIKLYLSVPICYLTRHVEKVFKSMSFDGTNQSESFADSMDLFDNSYDYCLC